jgi:hypothetical protein
VSVGGQHERLALGGRALAQGGDGGERRRRRSTDQTFNYFGKVEAFGDERQDQSKVLW